MNRGTGSAMYNEQRPPAANWQTLELGIEAILDNRIMPVTSLAGKRSMPSRDEGQRWPEYLRSRSRDTPQ